MNIQFNEDQNFSNRQAAVKDKTGWVTGLVIRLGLAKNAQQATLVQIIIIVVLTLFIFFSVFTGNDTPPPEPDPAEGIVL